MHDLCKYFYYFTSLFLNMKIIINHYTLLFRTIPLRSHRNKNGAHRNKIHQMEGGQLRQFRSGISWNLDAPWTHLSPAQDNDDKISIGTYFFQNLDFLHGALRATLSVPESSRVRGPYAERLAQISEAGIVRLLPKSRVTRNVCVALVCPAKRRSHGTQSTDFRCERTRRKQYGPPRRGIINWRKWHNID